MDADRTSRPAGAAVPRRAGSSSPAGLRQGRCALANSAGRGPALGTCVPVDRLVAHNACEPRAAVYIDTAQVLDGLTPIRPAFFSRRRSAAGGWRARHSPSAPRGAAPFRANAQARESTGRPAGFRTSHGAPPDAAPCGPGPASHPASACCQGTHPTLQCYEHPQHSQRHPPPTAGVMHQAEAQRSRCHEAAVP